MAHYCTQAWDPPMGRLSIWPMSVQATWLAIEVWRATQTALLIWQPFDVAGNWDVSTEQHPHHYFAYHLPPVLSQQSMLAAFR